MIKDLKSLLDFLWEDVEIISLADIIVTPVIMVIILVVGVPTIILCSIADKAESIVIWRKKK